MKSILSKSAGLAAIVFALLLSVDAAEVDISMLPPPASRKVDFVTDVQPILAKSCYSCHGPEKQKAELRWDVKSLALQGGEHGPVIIPGKSAESLVIHLVAGLKGEDQLMPQKGDRLAREQISLLRGWIDQGADWPESASVKLADQRDHWAFKPPVRQPLPDVLKKDAARNGIDHFVLARLEKENLSLSPEADRVTLIRRLSLDLLGLPPTPKEVDEFANDPSADAYDKLVERLLASPHYGERWGRHWLDVARYADSNGFEKDARRSIWPYRDYVIGAFNRDLPFDQFTIEQLAGDLLPHATLDQRVATGFLRNSMMNQEGGIEPEQFRIDAMIDRMDAVGKAWLGLTIACAQCHNHKFDPISAKEYYQLFAFLNNDDEPAIEVPNADQLKQREELIGQARDLEVKAMRNMTNLTERLAAWAKEMADPTTNWTVLEPGEWMNFATKFEKQSDSSLLGGGDVKPGGMMHVWLDTTLSHITGFRLEVLTHPNLPYYGPGQVAKGNFLLKEFTAEAYALDNPTVTNQIKFTRALASAQAPGFGITNAIDGDTKTGGWSCELGPLERNKDRTAVFACAEPVAGFPGGTRLHFTLHEMHSNGDGHSGAPDKDSKLDCHMIGRFRLAATTQPGPLKIDPLTAEQRVLLNVPAQQRSREQTRELFHALRLFDASFAGLNQEISNVFSNWPSAPTTLALQHRVVPRDTRIFKRG
ncbi:MAG: DUF1549 domain-containing protein, partial [Verrucomicrobiales bacterium]|nr:DUF1549 domain-containing protein [Verrucomicrobiales bacterium]